MRGGTLNIAMAYVDADGGRSGISAYLRRLTAAFAALDEDFSIHLFHYADDELPPAVRSDERFVLHEVPARWRPPAASILWHAAALPLLARRSGARVLFLPAGNRRLVPFSPIPTVSMIHDLSQLHVEAKYDGARMFYVLKVLPLLMRRLDAVICCSRSTADDVVGYAGVDPARIRVIHHGVDHERFRPPADREAALARLRERYGVRAPYILYTARIEHPGKNHARLLEAMHSMRARYGIGSEYQLVLAGSRWSGAEVVERRVEELGLGDSVLFTGFVPDEDMPALYGCAELFVFPSLYEGFGFPVLEAMACGTPVACSRVSSLPEICDGAAAFFDPADPEDIAATIAGLLLSKGRLRRMARQGLRHAASFTWNECAARTLEVFREAAQGSIRAA